MCMQVLSAESLWERGDRMIMPKQPTRASALGPPL